MGIFEDFMKISAMPDQRFAVLKAIYDELDLNRDYMRFPKAKF